MGKKIRLVFGFICLFFLFPLNMEAQKNKTEAGKVIDKVVKVGEKGWKLIEGLFPKKHKTPANYIPVKPITLTTRDSFPIVEIEKNVSPELELKVLYPRITPDKGYVSFQMGDYKYFRYLKDVKIEDIEHIKLISKDSSECDVKKFRIIEKKEISRHFSFLLDHSGSMGGKRANVLQASLFNAVLNDVSKKSEKNTIYTIYKFDQKNRRIVSSRDINEIKKYITPPNKLRGFGGGTAIKDAILSGVDFMALDKDSDSKLMVLFTDGETNSDRTMVPMEDIIRKALDNNINIVTVAFGSHLSKGYLENISSNSGGDLYWIYNENEFQQLFDNLFEDVFLSYDLEFSPCMFGSEITIELKVKGIDESITGTTVFRTPTDKGFSIDMDILFELSSFKIDEESFEKLDRLVQLMNYRPEIEILVEGHTDRLGDYDSNMRLSINRANSVKKYLLDQGINGDRIQVKGYGEDKPAYPYDDGSEINPFNRRIEIKINN